MKLKKFVSVLTTVVMMLGMIISLPASKATLGNPLSALSGLFEVTPYSVNAAGTMRRPCSAESPMWIVHIDSWNYADPEKIIDLIPDDVLPYVVFNISLSINWNHETNKWLMIQNGYECAKSWLKTCADRGVWTMIQPSSGGQSHFPDYDKSGNIVDFINKDQFVSSSGGDLDNTIYGEFFRDYPNFIGYNYCEQFWGFEQQGDFPITPVQRYEHFAQLLKLCNKYGGYLDISWCANQWSPNINPIAMLKRVPSWEESCRLYSDNLILEEKYTQASYIADVESTVYGAYISGYCGNFGIRYDETGWTDSTWSGTGVSSKDQYRLSTGLPIHLERMALNGATVIDGPELVWADDFKELWPSADSEGYTTRKWDMYDQYQNTVIDMFRKVQDGTIRIPDRKEVIERTKVVIIQDVNSGSNDDKYSTYPSLFEGLYRMPGDGNLKDNHNLYKSTGRYQTIPTVYALKDDLAKSIPVQVKQSEIASRWSTIAAKQDEFNKLYASEYWGNCYVGRNENTWIAYNPYKDGTAAGGVMLLKYNTCKEVDMSFTAYGSGIMNEYSDHIDFYLNNYDEDAKTTLKTTTIKISGCSSEPNIKIQKDRGFNQTLSDISSSYSNGTYTITVKHNGPVDLSVSCCGNEIGRQIFYQTAKLVEPLFPDFYEGERQYEGEFFDYKNIEGNVTNGCGSGTDNFWGQGFMKFGVNSNAAVKDTVSTEKSGTFNMTLRYSVTSDTNNVDLYVNGSKVNTLSLSKGSSLSDWKTISQQITLNKGDNKIELKANAALPSTLYIDCFILNGDFGDTEPQILNGTLIKNLTVTDTLNAGNWSINDNGDFNIGSTLFGDRDFTVTALPSNLISAEVIKTACDSKLVTTDLGSFTAGDNITVYVAMDSRVTEILPLWLNSWTKTNFTMKTSNDLTLELFKKNVGAGEIVTLGTNGGNGNSVNYVVLAINQQNIIKGDVNFDGVINSFDIVAVRRGLISGFENDLSVDAADVNLNGQVDEDDLKQLQDFILGKRKEFTLSEITITPDNYMNQIRENILENEPSEAIIEKSGTEYGTYEKKTIYSNVCKRNKSFNVLLPAGYTSSKKYPVMYVLHGYWGNEDSLLDAGDVSLRLRQIIGNAISDGEAEDMIVVFPDIYASETQDKCDGLDAKNNAAYDNFINLLIKEIMPYMEQNYSVKVGRENTAITGFSMGGRESLYIGFSRPDLFSYVGAMCPAPGLTTDLLSDSELKFDEIKPYLLMVSAGSNDQIVWSTPVEYHEAMLKNDTNHIWHYVSGGDHGGYTIRPHMYNFVRAVFKIAE